MGLPSHHFEGSCSSEEPPDPMDGWTQPAPWQERERQASIGPGIGVDINVTRHINRARGVEKSRSVGRDRESALHRIRTRREGSTW